MHMRIKRCHKRNTIVFRVTLVWSLSWNPHLVHYFLLSHRIMLSLFQAFHFSYISISYSHSRNAKWIGPCVYEKYKRDKYKYIYLSNHETRKERDEIEISRRSFHFACISFNYLNVIFLYESDAPRAHMFTPSIYAYGRSHAIDPRVRHPSRSAYAWMRASTHARTSVETERMRR